MRTLVLTLLLLVATLSSQAQLASKPGDPIKGTFYVSVDDAATIYINGTKFYTAGIGENRSPETELKVGDRIVIHLRNDTAERRFLLVFAGTETIVNFRARDFKIVPDLGVTDFTPEKFESWKKSPRSERIKDAKDLPIKNSSDWMWGDLDKTIIAGTITSQMVGKRRN